MNKIYYKYCLTKLWLKKHKLLAFGILLYLLYSMTFIHIRYQKAERLEKRHVIQYLTMAAKTVSYILPDKFHDTLLDSCSTNIDLTNTKRLTDFARENSIRFIYSLIESGKNILYTSSSIMSTNEFADKPNIHYGIISDNISPAIRNAFDNLGRSYEEGTDELGDFFAVYWTREHNGHKWVAGAELRKEVYDEQIDKSVYAAIYDLIATTLAAGLIAITIIVNLRRRIVRLTDENKSQKQLLTIISRR